MGGAKKKLKMHRLSSHEVGTFRKSLITMLSASPDPYVSVSHSIEIEPCRRLLNDIRSRTDKKISLIHVLNKLVALAIQKNPVYNQVLLGNAVYQLEEIHITNVIMLSGEEKPLASIVLENPHLKSLDDICNEYAEKSEQQKNEYEQQQHALRTLLLQIYFKLRLYKLVSQKKAFKILYESGRGSNIILSNHWFEGPGRYFVIKPIITPVPVALRLHTFGSTYQPAIENGVLVNKEVTPLMVCIDHRLIHGVYVHQFGLSLERISSNPEKYLL